MKEPRWIELRLRDTSQLFNSMDPSPFHEKDLDRDAEDHIVSWAQEIGLRDSVALRVHLERCPDADPAGLIRDAVHNYFSYRREHARREFRHMMRRARTALIVGLGCMATLVSASNAIVPDKGAPWVDTIKEGLMILGWVSMWRPVEMSLYDWWPLRQDVRMYDRLALMPVEVVRGKS